MKSCWRSSLHPSSVALICGCRNNPSGAAPKYSSCVILVGKGEVNNVDDVAAAVSACRFNCLSRRFFNCLAFWLARILFCSSGGSERKSIRNYSNMSYRYLVVPALKVPCRAVGLTGNFYWDLSRCVQSSRYLSSSVVHVVEITGIGDA